MNLQRFWYIVTVAGVLLLTFYLGFLSGNRERISDEPDNIAVVGPNLSIQNSLTEVEIRDIQGSSNSTDIQIFGQLFFKTTDDGETEVLITMKSVPAEVVQSNNQVRVNIPNDFQIKTARRSIDGQNFEYEPIGVITLDEPVDGTRTGKFSTILEKDISRLERIVFEARDNTIQNVFTDNSPDLPPIVRTQPAPFFWSEL